jgi:hypothetical protein
MLDACNISPGPGLVKHGKTAKEIGRKPGAKRQNGEKSGGLLAMSFLSAPSARAAAGSSSAATNRQSASAAVRFFREIAK